MPFVAHEHILAVKFHERHVQDRHIDVPGERVMGIDADPEVECQ